MTYTFVLDTIDPTFTSADFSTVKLTVGDTAPTVPQVRCNDANTSSTNADRNPSTVSTATAGDTTVTYTCRDLAGNEVEGTKLYQVSHPLPAVPTNISIKSNNAYDSSKAQSGDIVIITFDTEAGSTVTGTIDGNNAKFTFNGTSSTLTKIITDGDSRGHVSFEFTQRSNGVYAIQQTAVKGDGSTSFVNNVGPSADVPAFNVGFKIVSTSSVVIDGITSNGSTVTLFKNGISIGTFYASGGYFKFTGVSLDEGRNVFTASSLFRDGIPSDLTLGITISFIPSLPVIPTITTTSSTTDTTPTTISGTAEAGSTVELFKGKESQGIVTASDSGAFKFTKVVLSEDPNSFTVTSTDGINVSHSPDVLVITLDTSSLSDTIDLVSNEFSFVDKYDYYPSDDDPTTDFDLTYVSILVKDTGATNDKFSGKPTPILTASQNGDDLGWSAYLVNTSIIDNDDDNSRNNIQFYYNFDSVCVNDYVSDVNFVVSFTNSDGENITASYSDDPDYVTANHPCPVSTAELLGFLDIPSLVTFDPVSASTGERFDIPYQSNTAQSNEVVTTLSVSNSDVYTVSRVNDARALAISYDSTNINSIRDTDNNKIEFIEAVDITGDSSLCPCNVVLGFDLAKLPSVVTSIQDLKIYHFTDGDTVTAEYEDNTLPVPYTTADELDITATYLIGTVVLPLERAPAANLRTVDAFGNGLDAVSVDQQVQISADLANGQDREQTFAYLVQIQDGNGVTVSLAWITGSLSAGQSFSPALSWIPTQAGTYIATAFVWESVDNPTALSPPVSITVTVQ